MSTPPKSASPRTPLNRERVALAGVRLADESGIDAVSMRNLAQDLGVVHGSGRENKPELFDTWLVVENDHALRRHHTFFSGFWRCGG